MRLHSKFGQAGMVRRARSQRPQEAPFGSSDRHIIDAGFPPAHQSLRVEFPLFISVRSVPVAAVVVPFVLKAHRDAIVVESPKLLDQTVIEFTCPFAPQKLDDRGAALEKL